MEEKEEINWEKITRANRRIMAAYVELSATERIILRTMLIESWNKNIVGKHLEDVGLLDIKQQIENIKERFDNFKELKKL